MLGELITTNEVRLPDVISDWKKHEPQLRTGTEDGRDKQQRMMRFSSRYCNKISYLSSYVHRKIVIFVLKRVRTTDMSERIRRVKQHTCFDTIALGHRIVTRGQMW